MVAPSNRHVQKYNQMVDVYDPRGVEKVSKVQGQTVDQEQTRLERQRETIRQRRETVESLAVEDILSEAERASIADTDSLPDPAAVAAEKREDMLERLDLAVEALDEVLQQQATLDTSGFDGFDDPSSAGPNN